MELRQEADVRNQLCDTYKIDPKMIRVEKTDEQKEAEAMIKEVEKMQQMI